MSEKKGLFGRKKKSGGCCDFQIVEDTGETSDCGCEGGCCPAPEKQEDQEEEGDPDLPTVKVLGTGCKNCIALEQNVRSALGQLERKVNLVKVSDLSEIQAYGVMAVPGLVIEDEVVSYGKVLKLREIATIMENIFR